MSLIVGLGLAFLGHPVDENGEPGFCCMFWNVENLFEGRPHFRDKCNGIAKTIMLAGDAFGGLPDVVGLAEVENASVLRRLTSSTGLRKSDYAIVHYDSPDRRGIDCALLYRRSRFRKVFSKPCHLRDSAGRILPTRDILLAVLEPLATAGLPSRRCIPESVAVLVNHHPSKVGKDSGWRRAVAMARLLDLRDSLLAEGISRIIAVGDFNDAVAPAAGVYPAYPPGAGTIKFQGRWEKIDGCPVLEGFSAREHIFAPPCLSEPDRRFTGLKPHRSWSGPRWNGGLSDHYPIILECLPFN